MSASKYTELRERAVRKKKRRREEWVLLAVVSLIFLAWAYYVGGTLVGALAEWVVTDG